MFSLRHPSNIRKLVEIIRPKCLLNCYSTEASTNKEPLLLVEDVVDVRLIGINRPEKRNCINIETAEALHQAFKDFEADDKILSCVLYGRGGNFCAGYDLSEAAVSQKIIKEIGHTRGPMGPTRYATRKPVVAAIDGYAVAGGLELALCCDQRIMERSATLGVFCRRFGVPLIDGGTSRLPALIGMGRAMDLILSGRPVNADEALKIRLIHQIVATGCALGQATYVAHSFTKKLKEGLWIDKTSTMNAFCNSSLQDALEKEHQRGAPNISAVKVAEEMFMEGKGRHGGSVLVRTDIDAAFEDFYKNFEHK